MEAWKIGNWLDKPKLSLCLYSSSHTRTSTGHCFRISGGLPSDQRRHQEQVDDGPGRELQPRLFPGEEDDRGAAAAATVQGRERPDQDSGPEAVDHSQPDQEDDVHAQEKLVHVVGVFQRGRKRGWGPRSPEQAHHCQVQAGLTPIWNSDHESR